MAYNAESIKYYEGLEGVRAKYKMYVGADPLFHCLREAVENSVDEAIGGYNNYIEIIVGGKKTQTFTIIDNGRGIPVEYHKKSGMSALTTILTKLHAGGKMDDKAYKHSRGTHGVGISVTNALSEKFEVWTYRKPSWWYQSFKEGKQTSKVIKKKPPFKIKKGTVIKFSPDFSILKKQKLSDNKLSDWCYDVAMLNHGLKIRLKTKKIDKTYYNKGGLKDYLKEIIENEGVSTIGKPFIFESDNLAIAIQWSDLSGEDGIVSYVNGAYTENGGTHVQGFYDTINKSFRQHKIRGIDYTSSDLREGVIGFINYKSSGAEFHDQIKSKLISVAAKKDVSDQILPEFKKFLNSNKSATKQILKRATDIKKAKEQAKTIAKNASKIKKDGKKVLLPGKLIPADKRTAPKDVELIIVEGDSAGGSARNGRDRKFQSILPLRGKVINPYGGGKHIKAKVLSNTEVQSMMIGIGIDPTSNTSKKYNVGKIIISSDADADGYHITQLVISVLWSLDPELFKRRMVYITDLPLFVGSYKDKKWFGNTIEEIYKQSKGINKNVIHLTRLKGLGEMDADELKKVGLDPKTRKLIRIDPINNREIKNYIRLVGENPEERKRLAYGPRKEEVEIE